MDAVEKRILLYMVTGIITSVLGYLDVIGIKYTWNPETLVLINGIIGSVLGAFILLIRYKYKISVKIPGIDVPDEIIEDIVPEPVVATNPPMETPT